MTDKPKTYEQALADQLAKRRGFDLEAVRPFFPEPDTLPPSGDYLDALEVQKRSTGLRVVE